MLRRQFCQDALKGQTGRPAKAVTLFYRLGKAGWEEARTGSTGVCKMDTATMEEYCKKNAGEKVCLPTCPANYVCPAGSKGNKDLTTKCKGKVCGPSDCCSKNPPCKAATVLANAADAGSCGKDKGALAAAASCTQKAKPGFTCSASTCPKDGTKLAPGNCTANPVCNAAALVEGADAHGTCKKTLAAATNCLQKAKDGFVCQESKCPAEGTKIQPGACDNAETARKVRHLRSDQR